MTMRLLAVGLLAALPAMVAGQPPILSMRSVADSRERPSDEHDRPYFRETQSHRGWEIRTPQFTIFADTSREDARLAAVHAGQAWQAAAELAARWTDAPKAADFGLSALQVVVTSEPLRDRDRPATTLTVVGIQTQVEINVAAGQPPLAQQLVRLREGAAFGMLHAAGLDAIAPSWVTAGMATFAGGAGITTEVKAASASASQLPQFGGDQWRYGRAAADQLAQPAADHAEAAAKVAFLLTGNDGEHAPALFGLLAQAQQAAYARAGLSDAFAASKGDAEEQFEQFFAERRDGFAAWKEHPESGQPIFEPHADDPPELRAAQAEMVVLLKLLGRFAEPVAAEGRPAAKITELGKDGRPVSRRVSSRGFADSYGEFAERLLSSSHSPWATIGAGGELLLSRDTDRVQQLLRPAGAAYELSQQNGKTILTRRAASGPTISAWLEENQQNKSRPLARFAVRSANSTVRVNEFPRGNN